MMDIEQRNWISDGGGNTKINFWKKMAEAVDRTDSYKFLNILFSENIDFLIYVVR